MALYRVSLSIEVDVEAQGEDKAKELALDQQNWESDEISIIGATDAIELDEDGCPLD